MAEERDDKLCLTDRFLHIPVDVTEGDGLDVLGVCSVAMLIL